jgi:crotonobetainyl-CoA:carnitine CoA-transferase CaiB-like acyl-CoA transferase
MDKTGPYRERPGYGVICEAVSGLRHITGDPDRPPGRIATSTTDYITGLYAAFGGMLALESRHKTGKGQVVDAGTVRRCFQLHGTTRAGIRKTGRDRNARRIAVTRQCAKQSVCHK